MRVTHKHNLPVVLPNNWEDRWDGPDGGMLASYARGREKGEEQPALRTAARSGELPVLPWAGGLAKAIESKAKLGSLLYLAMWQGIRGDDLDIDTSKSPRLTCTKFGVSVTFTGDIARLSASTTEEM